MVAPQMGQVSVAGADFACRACSFASCRAWARAWRFSSWASLICWISSSMERIFPFRSRMAIQITVARSSMATPDSNFSQIYSPRS